MVNVLEPYGVDITDPWHLHALMLALSTYGRSMERVAVLAPNQTFFGLNQEQAILLAASVRFSWTSLTLVLSRYLPRGVRRLRMQAVFRPAPDPSAFHWREVAPTQQQFAIHAELRSQATRASGPGLMAWVDKAHAFLRDANQDGSTAFMFLAVTHLLGKLSLMLLEVDDGVPADGAERFAAVALVTAYLSVPEQFKLLCSNDTTEGGNEGA